MDFIQRTSAAQVEEGTSLAPRFDADGLVPVVTTDQTTGEVLMMGVMTAKALRLTIKTGTQDGHGALLEPVAPKGATSGLVQHVVEARIDDDQDAVWLRVKVSGRASCHVGYRSALWQTVPMGQAGPLRSVGHAHGITGPLHGGTRILHGVSFVVPQGQVLAICGAKGAGKSTLLRMLHRHLRPDAGQVLVGAEPETMEPFGTQTCDLAESGIHIGPNDKVAMQDKDTDLLNLTARRRW